MRQMKDSGIEWIGEIPAEWDVVRTKNCYTHRKQIAGCEAENYERLALTLNGVIKRSKNDATGLQPEAFNGYQVLRENELVFKLIDLENVATSRVGYSPYVGIVSPAYIILQPCNANESKYGEYYFLSMWQREIFNHLGDDGVRSSLNAGDLLNIPYLLVPDKEKEKIAEFLRVKCNEIDAVIEKTKITIEEYKKLRQTVIADAVTKGICGNRQLKESGLSWVPELPAEWAIIPSKFLFRNSDERKRPDDEQLTASQKYGIITQREYMERENSKIVLANKGLEDWKHVEPFDFVISLRSFQGGLEMSETTGCITWHYIVLKPCKPIVSRYYKWLFKSEVYIKALQRTCNFIRDGQDLRYSNFVQVPLFEPTLKEQQEIADFLDRKCAEIDVLIEKKTALLAELEAYKKAVIFEYVTGKKEVGAAEQAVTTTIVYPYFPAVLSTKKARFAQAVLMSRILDKCRKKMGRVKLEKMLYTIETSIGFDFDTEYVRQAAGPLDDSIYECEGIISRRNKWYAMKTSQYGVSYTPTKDSGQYKKYYDKYFADYDSEIERIIGIFMDYDADQAEIVATLFAAWNDFVIDQKEFTDEQLVDEVLNNWNDSKKRFSRDVWLRAIEQMRQNNIVPKGYGKRTVIKN